MKIVKSYYYFMKDCLSITFCFSDHFDTKKSDVEVLGKVHLQFYCKYALLHSNNDKKYVTWKAISLNLQPIRLRKKNKKINPSHFKKNGGNRIFNKMVKKGCKHKIVKL